ncbi:ABC transporter permease [Microbacterium sp.]|uniref:ABC transporter permease n=1 Tax=Microbacterium sp. TaxID=51671 RepID=UPI0028120391|nr:ABC transporter permease [Microbacterium sp.]
MRQFRFIGWRVLQAIPSVLMVSLLTFLMLRMVPGDPARVLAGPRASAETIERVRSSMGLDEPVWMQYFLYVGRAVRGDFGYNLTGSSPVLDIVSKAAAVTGALAVVALLLTLAVSLSLALLAARRPGGIADGIARVFSVGGLALPTFWIALMLIVLVALPTGLFPVGGWPAAGFDRQLNAVILPAVTLSLSVSPILVRSLRSSLLEVLGSDYVLSARAIGVGRGRLLWAYVIRNGLLPSIPLMAVIVGFLLGGTVVVETAFNLPGLGQVLVNAVSNRDANLVQGIVLVLGTLIILVYLLADVLLSLVDPRARQR